MSGWIKSRSRFSLVLFALLSLLFLNSAVSIRPGAPTQERLLVGIARWRHDAGPSQDVQEQTFNNLVRKLKDVDLGVEVIKIPSAVNNANDVDAVAAQYGADVLIWGWYDEVAVRGYVDLANATEENGMTNSLGQFLENGGNTDVIRVLKTLSGFDYDRDGVYFCVPRWTP
jgi:hypothetical protein